MVPPASASLKRMSSALKAQAGMRTRAEMETSSPMAPVWGRVGRGGVGGFQGVGAVREGGGA
jgi:hypothetical protein